MVFSLLLIHAGISSCQKLIICVHTYLCFWNYIIIEIFWICLLFFIIVFNNCYVEQRWYCDSPYHFCSMVDIPYLKYWIVILLHHFYEGFRATTFSIVIHLNSFEEKQSGIKINMAVGEKKYLKLCRVFNCSCKASVFDWN